MHIWSKVPAAPGLDECIQLQLDNRETWLYSTVQLQLNVLPAPTEGIPPAERSWFSQNGAHLFCGRWPNSHEEWYSLCNDQRQEVTVILGFHRLMTSLDICAHQDTGSARPVQ